MLTPGELAEVHRRASKPPERWSVGMEMEKMGVDARSGRPLPYAEGGGPSVRSVLEFFASARPSRPILEDGNLIALEGDWGTITIEPGGQVEWSSAPAPNLSALAERLRQHLVLLRGASEALGVRWLDVALQPATPLEEMPWMPKHRYRIMRDYFLSRGSLAHRMMTQTASVQVSVDYSDEADWREKFRAGFLLAPLAVALFANSRWLEGRDTGYSSYRSHIWRHTDDDRCGAPRFVFREKFGFEDWVEWLLDVPAMFFQKDGVIEPAGGVPFRRLLADGYKGAPVTLADWELHLTEVFPEARTKGYIELRSADLPPDDRVLSVAAFWIGLMYDERVRPRAIELLGWGPGRRPGQREWLRAMEEAAKSGLSGRLGRRSIRELVASVLELAREGLSRREPTAAHLLDGLGSDLVPI